ncbi:MAG: DMT family transporter [Pseudomonadota bacterium]
MTSLSENVKGILWMILSMAAFAAEDALLKGSTQSLPIAQVLILFGAGGMLLFGGSALLKGQALYVPEVTSKPMLIRAVFEVSGRLFYVLAFALAPLSIATVILQATPLVVVAAAAVLFGETVGWRRWAAIILGLIGVIIIVQPGSEAFSVFTIFAVLGMLGFAGRDLASRAAPAVLTTSQLGVYGFLALIVAGVIYAGFEQRSFIWPDPMTGLILVGAILFGVTGYAALMRAMRTGEVAAVTPFRYSRLLFGLLLSILFFGETLTGAIIAGSILILASGLFIIWRSQSA